MTPGVRWSWWAWSLTLDGGVACTIAVGGGHVIQLVATVLGAGRGCGHVIDADSGGSGGCVVVQVVVMVVWWWWWSLSKW